MADLLGASIPERGAASTLQELLLRSQPLPRSPLRQYSSSSCSEAAAMAAADSLLTPLESCKNGVHSSWHQVVRQRQVSSGQHGHHRLWCGQPPSGAASAASRRPLAAARKTQCLRWGSDKDITEEEISAPKCPNTRRPFGALKSSTVLPPALSHRTGARRAAQNQGGVAAGLATWRPARGCSARRSR